MSGIVQALGTLGSPTSFRYTRAVISEYQYFVIGEHATE